MYRTNEVGRNQYVPLMFGTELTADGGNQFTDAFKPLAHPSAFEEAELLIYLGAFSATPAAEALTVTVHEADTTNPAEADNYAANAETEGKKIFGTVAGGGGGETLASNVQVFNFSPGFFKPGGIRFNIQLDSTAGTETVDCTAILRLCAPQQVPVTQKARADIMVTPS